MMKLLLASLIALTPVSASADDAIRWETRWETTSQTCWKSVYREKYVSGTRENPGYVTSWEEDVQIPCERRKTTTIQQRDDDGNDCTDGKIAGGILGGAAGAALSRDEGRWWAIPLGVVTGSAIGCDIDGG